MLNIFMKFLILFFLTTFVYANDFIREIDSLEELESEGYVIIESTPASIGLIESCQAKGDVALFVYEHRGLITEEQALAIMNENWRDTWSKLPIKHATYVELQRIIRDAYRTTPDGKWQRTESAAFYTQDEIHSCIFDLKY